MRKYWLVEWYVIADYMLQETPGVALPVTCSNQS